jgi:hypothetical protein
VSVLSITPIEDSGRATQIAQIAWMRAPPAERLRKTSISPTRDARAERVG